MQSTIMRASLGIALLALLTISTLVINGTYFRPFSIDTLFLRFSMEYGIGNPEGLSHVRILEPWGIKFHQDDLNDVSEEFFDAFYERARTNLKHLRSYDEDNLSPEAKLSKHILDFHLQLQIEAEQYRYHEYPFNQMFGLQSSFPSFMKDHHLISNIEDAHDYISRLYKGSEKFDQALQQVKVAESKGIVLPKFAIGRIVQQMRDFIAHPIEDNILYLGIAEKLPDSDIAETFHQELLDSSYLAIETSVYPSYQKLIDFFSAQADRADEHHGVWKHPMGAQYYQHLIRRHTTTNLSAEEIHRIGLDEVARIQAQIMKEFHKLGIDADLDYEAAFAQLLTLPELYYPELILTEEASASESTGANDAKILQREAQIIEDYTNIINEIAAGMPQLFHAIPAAPVTVKRIPAFKQATAPGAYYQPPSLDGAKPGTFYANLRDVTKYSKLAMRTLAYHEAIPGHHFQLSIQQQLTDLPFFRRFMRFTAYIEGWALYAEQLAWEAGYQEQTIDNIGRLQGELFRAVRLVVDTGIHEKRWTREQAIEYMQRNTAMSIDEVVSEIERYIIMPGQALAYKIGMLKILELREHYQSALSEESALSEPTAVGEAYDIRDFHRIVLANGALPLTVLEAEIDRAIAAKKAL